MNDKIIVWKVTCPGLDDAVCFRDERALKRLITSFIKDRRPFEVDVLSMSESQYEESVDQ